jgi:hypothetical protein
MAKYLVNEAGLAHARELIEARRYVLRSEWGRVQPSAEEENTYLARHSWAEYGAWHLALTDGAGEETKARYAFVYGDSAACTAWASSPGLVPGPAPSLRGVGRTRSFDCCSCWTPPAPEDGGARAVASPHHGSA